VTRVDARGQAANRAALAGGVESFEQDHEAWGHDLRVEKTGREQTKLRQSVLGHRNPILGFGLIHRQSKVDFIDTIRHGVTHRFGSSEYTEVLSLFEK
jgi:hypothetical protein